MKENHEKTTQQLQNNLLSSNNIHEYIKENKKEFISIELHTYLDLLLKRYKTTKAEVINKSDIDQTYGYQIFSGRKKPKRNKLIQLSFGFPLKVEEVQLLLQTIGVNELHPRIHRDAVILFCIKNKKTIKEANNMLYDMDQELIIV